MKNRVMIFIMLAVILVFSAAISGCSPSSKTSEPAKSGDPAKSGTPTEITWWVPDWDQQTAKELVQKFQAENPDAKVKLEVTTWDTMENKIRVALISKDAPEVITELESRIRNYAAQDLLVNLDSYYQKDLDKNDFISSALDINSYKGSLYGVPFRHDGSGILYNKGMFKKAGLDPDHFPVKWDEFLAAAKKLTVDTNGDGKIDQYGLAWPLGNQDNAITRFGQLLFTNGGEFVDDSGKKAMLNTPQAIAAMKMLTDSVKQGLTPQSTIELDNTKMRDLFINEKIAMYIGGQFDIDPIKKGKPSLELGTAVIPGPDGMATTTVNGFSMIIPKNAKQKDAAWKLMNFIAKPENMAKLTATFPGRKSALKDAKFSDPLLKPFSDQLEKGHAEPNNPHWTDMTKILYQYMQMILLKNTDVKEAMEKANAEINAILAK